MRTHIELDDHLLTQVQTLGRFAIQKTGVSAALAAVDCREAAVIYRRCRSQVHHPIHH